MFLFLDFLTSHHICIIILFVCFTLLCFYVLLHYVLPALQFNCACLIFMNMYVLCLYVNVLYMFIASLCYVVCVLPTLNKIYLIFHLIWSFWKLLKLNIHKLSHIIFPNFKVNLSYKNSFFYFLQIWKPL